MPIASGVSVCMLKSPSTTREVPSPGKNVIVACQAPHRT